MQFDCCYCITAKCPEHFLLPCTLTRLLKVADCNDPTEDQVGFHNLLIECHWVKSPVSQFWPEFLKNSSVICFFPRMWITMSRTFFQRILDIYFSQNHNVTHILKKLNDFICTTYLGQPIKGSNNLKLTSIKHYFIQLIIQTIKTTEKMYCFSS